MDKDIIIIGKLRSELKAAPLMPLLYAEQDIKIKETSAPSESELKVVNVTEVQEPKKRKLKRKTLEESNESLKAGTNESTN
jgi:hypothetical protein